MKNKLYTKEQVVEFIKEGRIMHLCGNEETLKDLPKGNWVAGMTPYFMDEVGKICGNKIYVDDFSFIGEECEMATFDENNIAEIAKRNKYSNGFIFVVLPIDSQVYFTFANHSLEYENIYDNPVVGYVSSVLLEEYGKKQPKVAIGSEGVLHADKAAVMYVKVPDRLRVRAEIMNFDSIDDTTPSLKFPKTGFTQSDCLIDGKPGNIARYLEDVKSRIGHYPQLITSQNGALVNRDVKSVNLETGEAVFFSPAYESDVYYIVKVNKDYLGTFNRRLGRKTDVIACVSCTSYFLQGDFEYRHIDFNGVYTFGEIAYQLLNKTIVTLEVDIA
ncbi:MAG: hypothetical protein J6T96_03145 [Bacteroidales bacterium]|nr:hypothetical protein [Bacteroidales bacterium]MBO7461575.1 hypothetical protein [Bacteroidales bacterium]MBO7566374.1 hypothetical protein [Bacteroidales bacterium]